MVGVHLPARLGQGGEHPGVLQRRPEPQLRHAEEPNYPGAAYGFQRFKARIGKTRLVGFDQLNPQLQERIIETPFGQPEAPKGGAETFAEGEPAPAGAVNVSAHPVDK